MAQPVPPRCLLPEHGGLWQKTAAQAEGTSIMVEPEVLEVGGVLIAVRRQAGPVLPGLVWLGGFRSDMRGTKAENLAALAREQGRPFLRHDYSGHGESGGDFRAGTVSRWLAESLAVFRRFSQGPQVVVGSSMGAWIALRLLQELGRAGEKERIAGLVLLAPAPDFTADLVEAGLTKKQKRELAEKGFLEEPSAYSPEPTVYTRTLIEDGRANLVLTGPIDTHCPIHIVQGLADPDVPHTHALKLVSHLPADDVTFSLVPDGDHRLSRPQDLDLIRRAVEAVIRQAG